MMRGQTLWRQLWLITLVCSAFLITPCIGADAHSEKSNSRKRLYAAPSLDSPVIALLTHSLPFQVVDVSDRWVQVRQGDSLGWIPTEGLQLRDDFGFTHADEKRWNSLSTPALSSKFPSEISAGGLFAVLPLDGLIQDSEFLEKMKHPFYRDRYFQFYRRRGVFYYLRTQLFYVRGICLAECWHNQLRLNLAKRRIFYTEIFGDLWPEDVMREMIRAQPGLLGNETLFAKGQDYFLELALLF